MHERASALLDYISLYCCRSYRCADRCGVMLNIAVSLLAIAAASLEALDVLSTYHMLARAGHVANPIVAWFMRTLGVAWPVWKLLGIAVIVILWAFVPKAIDLNCLVLMFAGYGF